VTGARIVHEGRLAGLVSITNINRRKEAEEKLKESEQKYRLLFETSPDYIVQLDREGRYLAANPATAKSLGVPLEELVGKTVFEVQPQEVAQYRLKMVRKALDEWQPQIFEDERAGRYFYHIFIPTKTSDQKEAVQGITRDITERKQAEEALRRSEERYRTTLEEMEDSYFEVDLAGNLTFVNNSVCRDLGYSMEELIGMSYKGFTAEDDIESVFRVFNEVYRTGVPNKGFPWKTTRKDGSHGFAETSISLLRNNKGEVIGFRGVGRDVTERKQSEEKLRQSEENYKTLFDSSVIGMYVLDAETFKVVMGNRVAAEMAGFSSAGEGVGINPLDFVIPEDREQVLEMAVKEFEQDLRRTHEVRVIAKDGGIGWISISSARIAHEGRPASLVSITNITERKQAEEALRQSEENYRALFDSSVIGTVLLDAETFKVVMVNQAALKMFGFSSAEEAFEAKPFDFILPEDREKYLEITKKAVFEQNSHEGYQLRAVTKDGREIWINITGARIMHEGRLAGLISFTDITEQKRQNERLMMTDRLASLGELAAGTAHELNNPLTSIIGFSQLLMEREVPDDIREDLKLIYNEAQRAAGVTKNLLTFARKHAPVKQRNQINNIIEDVLKLRTYEHKVNAIEVERQLDPDLPEIMVDYFQMQQLFFNIIINAEYFMIMEHNKGTLSIITKKQNNTVMISFADDGPGITAENLRRIFDPFFTTKEAGKGTGLGLSICHGIVTEHGGQIYARSQLGKGATFFVELPVSGS
jgi:two-component system, NtrC family, sensor kinase